MRNENVLQVTADVKARPEGSENRNIASGDVELFASDVVVLNTSAPLPFQVDEHVEVGEEVRLAHRYLDLRRPEPPRIMRLRSEVNRVARSEEHTSELQSRGQLLCRLLPEKKKK